MKLTPDVSRVTSCIRIFYLSAFILGVTPPLSAEIALVSRLSDARAFAVINAGSDGQPPQVQTDFSPAHLSNSASVGAESGGAQASCTSNSSIVADKQTETLQIHGDGVAGAYAILMGSHGSATGKLIVISFTLTDRSYPYSLTGELLAQQFKGLSNSVATAKLTKGSVTIFEVVATQSPAVPLAESGVLEPGDYTLSVDISAQGYGDFGPHAGLCESRANFDFTLGGATPPPAAQALNLSTRMRVQTGDNVGVGGFIITGNASKRVLLRAIGPSITGVTNPLADPVLELHGPGGFLTVTNNNWKDDPVQQALIDGTGLAPTNNLEAAIYETLSPGAYTAVVRGNNNTTGIALIEVYDLNPGAAAKLGNISTRALLGTGNDIVIAGFILGNNSAPTRLVLRGIGPSLAYFFTNSMADPSLEVRNSSGAIVASNNNWQDDPAQAAELTAAGLAPTNSKESALALTLGPGQYTALLAGVNNTTGVGLVEVYDRGAP